MSIIESGQLNPNQIKSLDRALKHVRKAAEHLGVTTEEACALISHREATLRQGGPRARSGRPATQWKTLTGMNLPALPLRLVIQKALHETRFNEVVSDEQAFGQLLDPSISADERKRRFRAMQKALRKIPKAEQERDEQDRKDRRKRRATDANQTSD